MAAVPLLSLRLTCLIALVSLVSIVYATPPLVAGARVIQRDGVWWLVDERGVPFFSLGVNVVDRGLAREAYQSDRPGYAAFRQHATDEAWAAATAARLSRWKFNTLGGWSDAGLVQQAASRPFSITPVLGLGARLGVPWIDLWAEDMPAKFEEQAVRALAPWKTPTEPDVVGYFLDNELGWWGDTLFLYTLKQPRTSATRQRLIALLRERYADFASLRRDFATDAASVDELAEAGTLRIRPGGEATRLVDEFLGLVAERYYALAAGAVRRTAPGALILGDRYFSFYEWPVVRAASRHVDVVSTNYGAEWPDGRMSRYFLDALHSLSAKPILVSEFYFAASENRSGNRNTGNLFPTVRTQTARAVAARRQLEGLARLPFVVGAHWFQYYDEPTHGRADGEDYNMGLVDIHDVPYAELTEAFVSLDVDTTHRRARSRAAARPGRVAMSPTTALDTWDLDRAYVEPATRDLNAGAFADAYVVRRPRAVLVGLATAGFADRDLYEGGVVAPESQMRVRVRADDTTLTTSIGPGAALGPATPSGAVAGSCRNTRCTVVLSIPIEDRTGPRRGRRVPVDIEFVYRGRRMTWTPTVDREAR